jgi:hypothetical protein
VQIFSVVFPTPGCPENRIFFTSPTDLSSPMITKTQFRHESQ